MDKQKRIGWLIGILVFLILIAYASGTFDSAPSTVDVPQIEIDADAVDEIRIDGRAFSLQAVRSNGIWQLSEPIQWLADSAAVSTFVRTVSGLQLESVVSLNPERYGKYGVDSTGFDVRIGFGDQDLGLVLSNEGPDFSTIYVRVAGDDRVFVGRPRVSVPSEANRWRDRIVARIPSSSIAAVSVTSPGKSYTVQNQEAGWTVTENGNALPADSAAVANWFRGYATLRADGFLEENAVQDSLVHQVEFKLDSGENRQFIILEQANELAVKYAGESRAIYRFFSSRKSSLLPDVTSIRAQE